MEPTTFKTLKEAKRFVRDRAADRALVPLLSVLSASALADVRDFLDDLTATHPRIRTLATRAAKEVFAPFAAPLRQAARHDDDYEEDEACDERLANEIPEIPIARHAREPVLPDGAVDLGRPEFYWVSHRVIEVLAANVTSKWAYPFEELVREGWMVAVEIAPKWDRSRSRYTTFLWRHVRSRLIDVAKKASNSRETTMAAVYADAYGSHSDIHPDAVDLFDQAVALAAMSYALGYESGPFDNPEQTLVRVRDNDNVRAAIASLEDRPRRLIELVYFEAHDIEAAGKALGVSYATARRDHEDALGAMRAYLSGTSNVVPLAKTSPSRKKARILRKATASGR